MPISFRFDSCKISATNLNAANSLGFRIGFEKVFKTLSGCRNEPASDNSAVKKVGGKLSAGKKSGEKKSKTRHEIGMTLNGLRTSFIYVHVKIFH